MRAAHFGDFPPVRDECFYHKLIAKFLRQIVRNRYWLSAPNLVVRDKAGLIFVERAENRRKAVCRVKVSRRRSEDRLRRNEKFRRARADTRRNKLRRN